MSAKIMGQVFDYAVSPTEQAVLLALADHADHNGENAYPSVALLAWKTGMTERGVQGILGRLRDRGALVEQRPATPREPTCYRIVLTVLTRKLPLVRPAGRGERGAPPRGEAASSPGGERESTPGVNEEHPRGEAAASPEPSWEPSSEPAGVARARATGPLEATWVRERRRRGEQRFTDEAALRELSRRISRALAAGATTDDADRALRAHAGDPRASVYYADEWIAEAREDRERHEHDRRKQVERDEAREHHEAAATRQHAALLARHPGLTLAEALEAEGVTHPSLRRRVAS